MTPSLKELLRNLVENLPEDCTWPQFHYRLYVAKKIETGLRDADEGPGYTTDEVRDLIKQWQREWEEHPERRYVHVESREQLIDHLHRIRDRLAEYDPAVETNQSTDQFLDALGAWLGVCDGFYRHAGRTMGVEQASWQLFADALDAAVVYE